MARLEVRGVEVRFGNVAALRHVDVDVPAGQVTGLVGAADAGKTTLCNVVTGLQRPQAGTVTLDGADVTALPPHRRARLGMARTVQRPEVFGALTVRENILVAADIRRRWARDGINTRRVADEVMAEVGLRAVSRLRCDSLPSGLARRVEVARALATVPAVLLLDEPSAGLDEPETVALADVLERLAARGLAVLVAGRDVAALGARCHTVTVLGLGRVVASGPPDRVRRHPAVATDRLGAGREADQESVAALA